MRDNSKIVFFQEDVDTYFVLGFIQILFLLYSH